MSSDKITFNRDNSCYICHRCLFHPFNLIDMKRHLKRKNKCSSTFPCLISNEEVIKLSLYKRYGFVSNNEDTLKKFSLTNLSLYDLNYCILNYHDSLNIIDIDSLDNHNQNTQNIENTQNIDLTIISNNKDVLNIKKETYKCLDCNTIYIKKENFLKHIASSKINKKKCENKRLYNEYIERKKALENNLNNSNNIENNIENNPSNIIVNGTLNSNCNIQNINNNNYNNNNTYKVEINDFILDEYNYKHISLNEIKNKDFFLYDKFLKLIMEDDSNKNIFIENKKAFIFTQDTLNKIPLDKGAYLLLDKVGKTVESYIINHPNENSKDYKHVDDYYTIIKNKYLNDTVHKEYDVDKRAFVHPVNYSSCYRDREMICNKIGGTLNNTKNSTLNNLKTLGLDNYETCSSFQLNIENFVSDRKRNKEFISDEEDYRRTLNKF